MAKAGLPVGTPRRAARKAVSDDSDDDIVMTGTNEAAGPKRVVLDRVEVPVRSAPKSATKQATLHHFFGGSSSPAVPKTKTTTVRASASRPTASSSKSKPKPKTAASSSRSKKPAARKTATVLISDDEEDEQGDDESNDDDDEYQLPDPAAEEEHHSDEDEVLSIAPTEESEVSPEPSEDEAPKRGGKGKIIPAKKASTPVVMKGGKAKKDTTYKSQAMDCGLRIEPREGDLPPVQELQHIFSDMVSRVPATKKLFGKTGYRKLRVATMCSGTESPLLALGLMSRALNELGWGKLDVEHVFSCEIEPFKQAYIERNFKPPILFRDIRELGQDEATTAYGRKVKVPGDVDLLVAGTSCVDFSNLNNKQKRLGETGESTDTFVGMMNWAERHRPKIIIQENVQNAAWVEMRQYYLDRGYSAEFSKSFDTKKYYIPHTRCRGYLIAIDERRSDIPNKWLDAVKLLQRPATSPFEAFMLPSDDPRVHQARVHLAGDPRDGPARTRTVDWEKCEVRHQRTRVQEKLGMKKPMTQWEEGGSSNLLDYMWHDWGSKQVDRVLDLLDINYLIAAKEGWDASYRAGFWNLSQNVDRNTMGKPDGICPCLTPTMVAYLCYRGGPMTGLEALHMQGLPIEELLLTRETHQELQNLAGNAMSSTVVGATMLAALVLSHKILRNPDDDNAMEIDTAIDVSNHIRGEQQLARRPLDLSTVGGMKMSTLLVDAHHSSRMCVCEGRSALTTNELQICEECGFSSCNKCGGRPEHYYPELDGKPVYFDKTQRLPPLEFENRVKSVLPMRLVLSNVDEAALEKAKSKLEADGGAINTKDWEMWKEFVLSGLAGEFRYKNLVRQEVWVANYDAPKARLEFVFNPEQPEWRIFAKCPENEGRKSRKRQLCRQPFARMFARNEEDALQGDWEFCLPAELKFKVTIEGEGDKVDGWRKRLGMQDAVDEVWSLLRITVSDEATGRLDRNISGEYKLIQKCGAAQDALHRKVDSDVDGPAIYFLLDQERIGVNAEDSFVFSINARRIEYGDERPIIAKLDHKWRQSSKRGSESVAAKSMGQWTKIRPGLLSPPQKIAGETHDGIVSQPSPQGLQLHVSKDDCASANAVLVCRVPLRGQAEKAWSKGVWSEVDKIHERVTYESLAWLTERIRSLKQLSEWKQLELPEDYSNCERCAPTPPQLKWYMVKNKHKAVEDPQEAAPFERALKNRPSPFVTHLKLDKDGFGTLRIGMNIPSLVHRALSRLPDGPLPATASWRLITDYVPEPRLFLPEFVLKSNKHDGSHAQPPNFKVPLRPEQLRSLAWMLRQEKPDRAPFIEEEVSEALLPQLNWRAEGRAQRPNLVLGGVLADQVGYGKTAITVGLVDTLQKSVTVPKNMKGLIPVKATLIVVPPQLGKQWPAEIRKFTGVNTYKIVTVLSQADLNKVTVKEIMAADFVVIATSLFKSDKYLSNLAGFSGSRNPPGNEGRRFNDWQKVALADLAEQVEYISKHGATAARLRAEERRERLDKDDAEELFVQKKRATGSAYVAEKLEKEKAGAKRKRSTASDEESSSAESAGSGSSGDARSKKSRVTKAKDIGDPWKLKSSLAKGNWMCMSAPPMEMFHFNRVVIDEFTYLKGQIHAGITNLKGNARWVLSGTPPLGDFADVKTISVFLGIHLGIDDDMEGRLENKKKVRKDWSDVEKFTAFREVRSPHWHTRRHEIAQTFLDQFVRQNIAEIDEIPSEEHIIPVSLPAAERAIYLELEHHLQALEFNMKKAKSQLDNDRDRRVQESFGNSSSPEEALLKRCSHFDLDLAQQDEENAVQACDVIVRDRKRQLASCREEVRRKLHNAAKLHREIPKTAFQDIRDHFEEFLSLCASEGIGDPDANIDIAALIGEATAKGGKGLPPKYSDGTQAPREVTKEAYLNRPKKEGKKKRVKVVTQNEDGDDVVSWETEDDTPMEDKWPHKLEEKLERLRTWTTTIRTLCRKELAGRHRSLRYFSIVRDLQKSALDSNLTLDCVNCKRSELPRSESGVLSSCGHHGCVSCLMKDAVQKEKCFVPGCATAPRRHNVVHGDTLGVEDRKDGVGRHYGMKLEKLVDLLKNRIPKEEKILLFVQFADLMDKVSEVLNEYGVPHVQISGTASQKSKTLEKFQEADIRGPRVLLMNVMTESAAGSNLTVANHAIFLGPLHTKDDYEYKSCETQAIGRVLRYGQQRKVHIWRFLTENTIDFEIFEQRSRRKPEEWQQYVYKI